MAMLQLFVLLKIYWENIKQSLLKPVTPKGSFAITCMWAFSRMKHKVYISACIKALRIQVCKSLEQLVDMV